MAESRFPSAGPPRVGVLALQGDVVEHERALRRAGAEPVRVKRPEQLDDVDGLVLPGGESPAMRRLMRSSGLDRAIQRRVHDGFPLFGTCAGLILLARKTGDPEVPGFGALDVTVLRNAYGRQLESFECELPDHAVGGGPLEAVFIRAPAITELGPDVQVLAEREGKPVAVRQGAVMGAAFHPELTDDTRLYSLFMDQVRRRLETRRAGVTQADAAEARPRTAADDAA